MRRIAKSVICKTERQDGKKERRIEARSRVAKSTKSLRGVGFTRQWPDTEGIYMDCVPMARLGLGLDSNTF